MLVCLYPLACWTAGCSGCWTAALDAGLLDCWMLDSDARTTSCNKYEYSSAHFPYFLEPSPNPNRINPRFTNISACVFKIFLYSILDPIPGFDTVQLRTVKVKCIGKNPSHPGLPEVIASQPLTIKVELHLRSQLSSQYFLNQATSSTWLGA